MLRGYVEGVWIVGMLLLGGIKIIGCMVEILFLRVLEKLERYNECRSKYFEYCSCFRWRGSCIGGFIREVLKRWWYISD